MFILETNAWQTASRITQKHKVFKSHSIHIFYSHSFYKKFISTGTHPLRSRIAKSSVLNLHNHITVIETTTGDRWKQVSNQKDRRERFEIYRGKKQTGKKQVFWWKKQNEANPWIVCRYFTFPDLINFIEIALRHGCSPVNLLHIFRTPFPKNTLGRLLLNLYNVLRMCYFTFRVDLKFY